MLKFAVRKKSSELFHEAVDKNEYDRVKILLQQNQTSSHFNVDDLDGNGLTALQRACFTGSLSLVQLLVAYGANIKIKDKEGWTVLHAASVAGNFKIAKFLISLGIDTAALNDQGELPIDLASEQKTVTLLARVMLKAGHKELVVLCLKRHPEIYNKVFKPNNVDMSRNFSSGTKTRSISLTLPPHIEEECTHFNSHNVVNGNHRKTHSLDGRLRSESALDQKSHNALENQIWRDSNSTGSFQRPDYSPLSHRSSSGVSSLSPTSSETSVSSDGSVFIQGNNMNFWDRELCLKPLENGQTQSGNKLKSFSKEEDVNPTSTDHSFSHSQVQKNASPGSRRMKRQHAEICLSTKENTFSEKHQEGAKVRPSVETDASWEHLPNGNRTTEIESNCSLNKPPKESSETEKTFRTKTLELCALIKAGILNINKLNEYGISALHQAANNGNIEWVRLLLELGAEVNRQSLNGSTPLHEAVKGNNLNCVKYLIERGADLFAETDDGFLAIDQSKNPQIARLLQTAMAIR